MKNETKKLVKIITSTAEKYGKSIDRILTEFVEATYQFAVTGTYSQDYAYLVNEHTEFIQCLTESMKLRPYFDYFSEIMLELGKFDKRMCQCMTPPELVDVVTKMMLAEQPMEGRHGEISCGTGSFVLKQIESHVRGKNTKSLELIINDLDNRLVKITVIQSLFNLLVNNGDYLSEIKLRAYQNNIITEYNKNGYIVYDNDANLINEPYVQRFLEHIRFKEKLKNDSIKISNNLKEVA